MLITPIPWARAYNTDLLVGGASLVLLVVLLWRGRKRRELSRGEGAVLILGYVAYAAFLFGRFAP